MGPGSGKRGGQRGNRGNVTDRRGPVTPQFLAKAVKRGEVRNPEGKNGYSAAVRFRKAFESAASDRDLEVIVRGLLHRAKRGEKADVALVTERLWPKTDRLELGSIGDSEAHEREAAEMRLRRLLDAKGRT